MRSAIAFLAACILFPLIAQPQQAGAGQFGAQQAGARQAAHPATVASTRPYLLHLPGIAGLCEIDRALIAGLQRGGFNADVDIYDWTGEEHGMNALLKFDHNRAESKKVAGILLKQYRTHPDVPIYITAHSGGCGIAAWALESLPADVHVQMVVMIAPALSPTYDLSDALAHITTCCCVLNSRNDGVVLGAGTRILGTIDRQHSEAAGLNGFVRPARSDAVQYQKLIPIPYDPAWYRAFGNAGDHIGAMSVRFGAGYLAPLLCTGRLPASRPALQ